MALAFRLSPSPRLRVLFVTRGPEAASAIEAVSADVGGGLVDENDLDRNGVRTAISALLAIEDPSSPEAQAASRRRRA